MSEQQKSLGQIAYESFSEEMQPFYTPWSKIVNERGWESAAQAVAARVREECALWLESRATKYRQDKVNRIVPFALEEAAHQLRALNEASHD